MRYNVLTLHNTITNMLVIFFFFFFTGNGTQVWKKSGAIYNGEWKFGKCDGHGTYSVLLPETKEYAKKYCGGWKNGKKHVGI